MSVFRESIAPRKRRVSLVFSEKLGLLARRDLRYWVQQQDLRLAMCFFVPYDAVRSLVLKSFRNSRAIALQKHIPNAKQQYRS
ncbi:hypothetical protein PseudUWO311_23780 [Pseudanabaena sp. UWO311]|uniref:hypothetical protein n=1 Tax=Pseudanabaena sp. UWO311 TaxID=2487337 RepID=UPI0011596BC9|nr:hypothetical protein [Pseudanabaena sp. UWO311]TYQ23189.1 hypothetical protein PseudUWO311_23780 [Pseudanabaena sp. UWO311]